MVLQKGLVIIISSKLMLSMVHGFAFLGNMKNLNWNVVFVFQGVLRIHMVGAKDLKKADINLFGKGKSDPYVKLIGKQNLWIISY